MQRITSIAVLAVLAATWFCGCGTAPVTPTIVPAAPLDEVSFLQDNVLVSYHPQTLVELETLKFVFSGSVQNMGAALTNARFEIVATNRLPDNTGSVQSMPIATQSFGTLNSGQTMPIGVSAVLPNVANQTVTGRFAHD